MKQHLGSMVQWIAIIVCTGLQENSCIIITFTLRIIIYVYFILVNAYIFLSHLQTIIWFWYIIIIIIIITIIIIIIIMVEALCYQPEGRGFESRLGGYFNLPNHSNRIMTLDSNQTLTAPGIFLGG
jgi:hypothetical protein